MASNAVPLTHAEVPRYDRALRRGPGSSHGADVLRTHLVGFPSKVLGLTFVFDEVDVDPERVDARVERLLRSPGDDYWVRVPSEERRCRLTRVSEREFTLMIEAPIVGHRYGIVFRPRAPGTALDYTSGRIAQRLIDRCLGDRDGGPMLSCVLAESVAGAVGGVFGVDLDDVTWSGLLWDEARGRLATAFGNFPSRQWAVTFDYGAGIAGHAFRFNRPAAWCRNAEHSKEALVYQRMAQSQDWESEHDWIVCVPIVGDQDHAPIGVVCFEGGGKQQGFGDRLREFANAALARAVTRGSPWETFQHDLSTAVNTGFWLACSVADGLADFKPHALWLSRELGLVGE